MNKNYINAEIIDKIKGVLRIEEVLSNFFIKHSNKSGFYYCPFCQKDSNLNSEPHFLINSEHSWQCKNGCGYGDSIEFIQKFKDIDRHEAALIALSLSNDDSFEIIDPEDIGFEIPDGWIVDESGISYKVLKGGSLIEVPVSYAPVYITGKYINLDTGEQMFRLTFLNEDEWESIIVERLVALHQSKIINLAKNGFPVNSLNARSLVRYLTDFEAENNKLIQKNLTVSTFGWKEYDNKRFFVIGKRIIGSDSKVYFVPESIGDEDYSEALTSKGNLSAWIETIAEVKHLPKVIFALYASFVPPLSQLISSPNFIIDFWGETSIGKTTTLEIASSVWGIPKQGSLVLPWNATKVSIERIAHLFNHLPVFFDDSQTNTDKNLISEAIYFLSNGTGKTRGAVKGSQKLSKWKTTGFSTGETPITESTQNDGAKVRVIEIQGSPFDGNNSDLVRRIKKSIYLNYGLAGIFYLKELVGIFADNNKLQELKDDYEKKVYELISTGKGKINVVDRMAYYFAAVELAGELAEKSLGIGADPKTVVREIFDEVCILSEDSDSSGKALESIITWVQSNNRNFDIVERNKVIESETEAWGLIKKGEYIAITPDRLKAFLEDKKYSFEQVIHSLKDKQVIQTDGKHIKSHVTFRGKRIRMFRFKWEKINSLF